MGKENMEPFQLILPNDSIRDIMEHPAFEGRGRLLFPWDGEERYRDDMTMYDMPSLHLWHTNMDVLQMTDGVNRMIDDRNMGKQVLYDIYTEKERAADISKRNTGLFFFRGKPGAPFAVVCPGGGFCYVGSLHEGFPVAAEISRLGYNAFVLKYRTGLRAKDVGNDLIAAVAFIRENAVSLGVDRENYSLWGGSAGARLCTYVTYEGKAGLRPENKLHPAANIIAYTYFDYNPRFTAGDPAGFFIVGTRDWLVPVEAVKKDAAGLKRAGADVELHTPKNAEHGFGVGNGTSAEGWIQKAVSFWEKHMV